MEGALPGQEREGECCLGVSSMTPVSHHHEAVLTALREHVVSYLTLLQGGHLGEPRIEHLQNAGILHMWLEDVGEIREYKEGEKHP